MTTQADVALTAQVLEAGRVAGLAAVGVTSAEVLEPAATVLPLRKAKGLAGSMNFTYRNPARSTDPRRALPTAQSLVAGALHYDAGPQPSPAKPAGRVARYAWRDHYADLRLALDAVAGVLVDAGWTARVHLDDNNLVDRNVAYRAGLGWYGKNANLLLPAAGSWFVLGSVLTDAPLAANESTLPDGCGPCRRCLDDCPTDAIVAPGVVDARRCLAWLVQASGPIPVEFREPLGDRLYGCDDCQEVCPPNRRLPENNAVETTSNQAPPAEIDPWIEISWLLEASDDELVERVGRWYIADRDLDVVRRTALVVLGNVGDPADAGVRRLVGVHVRSANDLLRQHAVWAARRLGYHDLVTEAAAVETNEDVLEELRHRVAARS